MTRKSVLTITIIGLVLLNLTLVGILLSRPAPPNQEIGQPRQGPKMAVIERLGFDDNQVKQYVVMIDEHTIAIKEKDAEIALLKRDLYKLLSGNLMINKADSLTSEIAILQKEIETLHFNHFKDIKSLCNEKQLLKFEKLSKDLANLFGQRIPPK